MLEVKNIQKVYGTSLRYEALKGIDFKVEDGEFVGIMGPSGSGKTTLLNLIATIDAPTNGEILLNQENPNLLPQERLAQFRRRELGFVFQSFNLMPTLTVEENIVLPLTLDGEKISLMKQKVKKLGEQLGIKSLLKKGIGEISGGQAQRVAIARAMIHDPKLLLADEPTGNLDTKSSRDVMHLLSSLNREVNATLLMVTHDPLAASYCQRILFIKDGQLVKEIHQKQDQKLFYDEIMQELSRIEGVSDEF